MKTQCIGTHLLRFFVEKIQEKTNIVVEFFQNTTVIFYIHIWECENEKEGNKEHFCKTYDGVCCINSWLTDVK